MTKNHTIKIRKGLDLHIAGGLTSDSPVSSNQPAEIAIIPDDYHGLTLKLECKEGEDVCCGTPLLHDKTDQGIKIVSPVSGTVKEVVRGERRKILRVIIANDCKNRSADSPLKTEYTAEDARNWLKATGLWGFIRQRPYDIVPKGDSEPRDIFVTAIDSAPLAQSVTTRQQPGDTQAATSAVALLSALTSGNVYISRRCGEIADISGAVMIDVAGPHPAGNVGVQIANISPVNKGETVWTLDYDTLVRIGRSMGRQAFDGTTTVAVVGSEVKTPSVVKTYIGASVQSILEGNIKSDCHTRIISGNVLTGVQIAPDGYLRYPYRQLTVIPEGDDRVEFMGWASISPKKMSQSRTFPGHFLFKRIFRPDARLLGGRRAFIMSGEYDRYMPMDIMPEYLLKAIIGRDIEKMEELGIYEVAPEDFALGEYADTSKIEAQRIVREGLDYLRKELE